MTFKTVLAAGLGLFLIAPQVGAASLSDLIAGGSLTEGDLVFDNFFFDDRFTDDYTNLAPTTDPQDREDAPFTGDRAVDASQVEITASSTANAVTLTATIAPSISISESANGIDPYLFDFFLDFTVSVLTPSTREITKITLGNGDLFASGEAFSEVVYAPGGFLQTTNRIQIFEDTVFGTGSSDEDEFFPAAATNFLRMEGSIYGESYDGGSAGLATYSLTFDLSGTAPPNVVPLPASAVLLLGGLAGLGVFVRRRPRTPGRTSLTKPEV